MRFLKADRSDKPRNDLTLMVIPHDEDRIREFHVSPVFIRLCIGVLALHLCAVGVYGVRYLLLEYRIAQSETLQVENDDLKSQLASFQQRLNLLSSRVDMLSASDTRFRAWTGLPEPGVDITHLGVGGGGASLPAFTAIEPGTRQVLEDVYLSLDRLKRSASFLETSFDTISTRMEESEIGRRNTPTILPLPQGSAYWKSGGYGYRSDPFTGLKEFHNGIDLAGHMGTPILATADGQVDKVGRDKRLGFYVSLRHGFGRRTLYGHLKTRPQVYVGQKVKRGDVIGEMGNTGRSTGPHLHYSVFRNGRSEDPEKYIID